MKNSAIFWGGVLIGIGVILLLINLGVLPGTFWNLVWPLGVIALGIWVLWGVLRKPSVQKEHVDVPLGEARHAMIKLRHGAGRLKLGSVENGENFISGDFVGGVKFEERRDGDLLRVKIQFPEQSFPVFWVPNVSLDWNLQIGKEIPIELDINSGASEVHLDLTRLKVTSLKVHAGASTFHVLLPEDVELVNAEFKTGAATLNVRVPANVAAQIKATSGLAAIHVDTIRFPRQAGGYQSPNYASVTNKVNIRVETGVGTVDIR